MPTLIFIGFFLLGIIVLVKLRAHAVAIAVPFLWLEMVLMGRLHTYPYLDLRTSHFLLVVSLVVVAIGAVGLLQTVARPRGVYSARVAAVAAVAAGSLLAASFTIGVARHVDKVNMPHEDVRAETLAVAARHSAHDVILVNVAANFGFSYYWPEGSVKIFTNTSGQGFRAEAAAVRAIYLKGRAYADVLRALRVAVTQWRAAGPGSRLFIVRTHLGPGEADSWSRAFRELDLKRYSDPVGFERLVIVGPS